MSLPQTKEALGSLGKVPQKFTTEQSSNLSGSSKRLLGHNVVPCQSTKASNANASSTRVTRLNRIGMETPSLHDMQHLRCLLARDIFAQA